ncbi:LuxR C-terminal-related transcriptional regulator [Nonomuraea sp. NPDC046570]|uniref:LuxR C-terminal-related transcriptional regulator n=1 Tax=Nonomuraea sp. NPDC046570 TaxID=3155255 RepID=UPI003401A91D
MAGAWPFAGRTAQLAEIRSAAGGLVVVGPPGAGKSRLVAQAVRRLPGVAWVRATAAAAELPLGAFGPLLPSAPPKGNPLGWAAASVKAPVLVVDDAHLLDPASAALVHHLVTLHRARVIATVRSETPSPDAVRALWKDDLLPRLDLGPLSVEETAALLGAALGGRVEEAAVTRLWQVSRGNALYLRELVLSGALTDAGGVWRGPLSMTPSLRETIAGRIGELTGDERGALEYLAFGEPLGADLLAGLTSPATVERLEDRQLVTVQRDGKRLQVRLAHPLYGEVIRAGCGVLRARVMVRRLAEHVERTGLRRREDVLRVAVWRLDGGSPGDPGPLLAACNRARSVRDLELAERLGRAAVAAGGGYPARIALGGVLFYADRNEESEAVLAAATGLEPDEVAVAECGIVRAFNLFWGCGRVEEARAVLAATRERLTGPRELEGLMRARASIELFAGDLATARSLSSRPSTHADLWQGRAGDATEAGVLAAEGRAGECLRVVDRTLAEIARMPDPLPSLSAALLDAGVLAALQLGDLDRARRLADDGHRLGGELGSWSRALLQFGTRRSNVLVLRGRVREALGCLQDAATHLPARSPLAGLLLGELAQVHALLGDVTAAEEALALAGSAEVAVGPYVTLPVLVGRVWTLAARGDLAGAVATALAVADGGLPWHVPFALHDLVRLGRPDLAAARLAALPAEGALIPLFARHAAARTGHDLDAVSHGFEELGMLLLAAEAAAGAARRYRADGLQRGARAAGTRAAALAGHCQGAHTPALVDLDVPGLTPRQREVAMLAARGLTNREIAERLVVSIRTVANTLYAVYDKTGVSDRAALAELLEIRA